MIRTTNTTLLSHKQTISNIIEHCKIYDDIYKEVTDNLYNIEIIVDDEHESIKVVLKGIEYHISEWALSQLCALLKLSKTYLNRCLLYYKKHLVVENINSWLLSTDSHLFKFQIYDDTIYGIVSSSYLRINHTKVVDALKEKMDAIQFNNSFTVEDYIVTPDFMHLRVIQDEPFYTDENGSPLFAGLYVQNSEVGRSHLIIDRFIYRQVCSNGLCVPVLSTNYKRRHIGAIDPYKIKSEIDLAIDISAETLDEVRVMLVNAEHHIVDEYICQDLIERSGIKVKDIRKTLVPHSISNDIYFYTLYNIINYLTNHSKNLPLNERLSMEKYAGSILN